MIHGKQYQIKLIYRFTKNIPSWKIQMAKWIWTNNSWYAFIRIANEMNDRVLNFLLVVATIVLQYSVFAQSDIKPKRNNGKSLTAVCLNIWFLESFQKLSVAVVNFH